jgi:hypothetical protein
VNCLTASIAQAAVPVLADLRRVFDFPKQGDGMAARADRNVPSPPESVGPARELRHPRRQPKSTKRCTTVNRRWNMTPDWSAPLGPDSR